MTHVCDNSFFSFWKIKSFIDANGNEISMLRSEFQCSKMGMCQVSDCLCACGMNCSCLPINLNSKSAEFTIDTYANVQTVTVLHTHHHLLCTHCAHTQIFLLHKTVRSVCSISYRGTHAIEQTRFEIVSMGERLDQFIAYLLLICCRTRTFTFI